MLVDRVQDDLKNALISRDAIKVSTLRLLLSEILNFRIALRASLGQASELSDADVVSVVQKEVKKRKEAVEGFRAGQREDKALKEQAEMQILQGYLPAQLSNDQLQKLVEDSINEVGAKSLADMGKVMGVVMGKVQGRVDGATVSSLVKEKLS